MQRIPVGFERLPSLILSKSENIRLKETLAKRASAVWGHAGNEWFRHKVRDALLGLQGNRCCYCRRPLSANRGMIEIDHIIHKGKKTGHPTFSFLPINLALSCKDCNNVKGRKPVLSNPGRKYVRYPTSSSAYVWVHPYIHEYSKHIEIYEGWVYKPVVSDAGVSENGKAVIRSCGLDKISSIEKANRISRFEQAHDTGALIREALAQTNHAGLEEVAKEIAPMLSKAARANEGELLALFKGMYELTQKIAHDAAIPPDLDAVAR
ncbi:HNH endonuclease [Burkholderia ubonensis]|uniref:HNH endonuclease n=1 Tax=Burkholderia ubonensis TaxID=101571 RepID=UPI000A665419|nr:HNH endonuclease signature motif containing protein [Burkholderia ubonensis]